MSQQLQITGGAKVRDLQDVIIGTSGVLSSLAFNVANGVPKLDVNGKILVSQLPNSVMEYLGTWDASTNTPTLVNGTGNQGDVYLCNVAGTVNFGAGPITFAVGDSAIYSGTIWQKAGGATGTVTSVGLTSTGNDAITITGSPITTSGNINLGFAGTNLQYINGAGDLTTFPTLISSIGLTMPSAFSVANSPLTANGTIAVTGAGYPSQYIRGDGTLADFPTSGGGGSSVSYYLNGGTSQGTIGGVTYYEMSKTADTGTGVDFTKSGDGFIVAFLTDAGDPAQLNIPAGNWNYEIYASMSANGGTPQMYAELYVYDGTTFTLISTSTNEILYDGTNLNLYSFGMTVPATILTLTDRLAIKLYATNSGGKTTTVHTQDSHLCQIITTFSTGITALNGLTAQVQYFATGTSGTDFNISSTTATHTFNLPVASASNTGKLSSTDWSTFNGKVPYTGATSNVDLGLFSLKANGILAYGNGTAGGVVSFTQTGTLAGIATGVASIGSVSAGKLNIYFGDAGLEAAILDNSLLTADRTYNFPDASGTLALLESTQTFSGTNTFGFIKADNGVLLKNGVVPASTGYTGIGAGIGTGIDITMSGSIYTQSLYFQTSAAYIYTFPAATGTIALTSQLGSYLPLAGGIMTGSILLNNNLTISGQLFGTSSYASMIAMSPSDKVLIDNSGRGVIFGGTIGQGAYTYTFPSATGTLALTSNITSAISGTTNYHAKFTGTNTIGNSQIFDNGSGVGIGTATITGKLNVSNGNAHLNNYFVTGTSAGWDIKTYFTGGNSGSEQFIYFGYPSAETNAYIQRGSNGRLEFGTAATSRMIIDASGNLGLGVTPSAWYTGYTAMQLGASASIFGNKTTADTNTTQLANNAYLNTAATNWQYINTDEATRYEQVNGQHNFYSVASGSAGGNITWGTSKMTINSTGNVGIGTSSPSQLLELNNSGSDLYLKITRGAQSGTLGLNSTGIQLASTGADPLYFSTNGTERMRITSGGNVCIGLTASNLRLGVRGADTGSSNFTFYADNGANPLFTIRNDGYIVTGTEANSPCNSTTTNVANLHVFTSNGALARSVASSKRFKENITDWEESGINTILSLKPKTFTYKKEYYNNSDIVMLGLIAEEVAEVSPYLADYENEDRTGQVENVRYAFIVVPLIKAIQEQQAQIEELKSQIEILINK